MPGYDLTLLYTIGAHSAPTLANAIIERVTTAGIVAAFTINAALLCCREIRMHRALPYGPVRTDRLAALDVHRARIRATLRRATTP
jgi:hypothetical protein